MLAITFLRYVITQIIGIRITLSDKNLLSQKKIIIAVVLPLPNLINILNSYFQIIVWKTNKNTDNTR